MESSLDICSLPLAIALARFFATPVEEMFHDTTG
jgi:DNA-binding XRE family transcriptional regulator